MDAQIYPTYKLAVLIEELALSGIDAATLLDGTGIDPDSIHSSATRISRRQLITAYVNANRLCPQPGFGLRAGKRLRLSAYGMYGYALVSSADLREALEFSIRYHELATPTVRMSLQLDDDVGTAIFAMEDLLEVDSLTVFNLELQFSLVLSLFRDMVGETFGFDEIRATFPKPSHSDQYTTHFGCPVMFGQSDNELRFDEWWLGKPLIRANSITSEMLRETCDRILLDMKNERRGSRIKSMKF